MEKGLFWKRTHVLAGVVDLIGGLGARSLESGVVLGKLLAIDDTPKRRNVDDRNRALNKLLNGLRYRRSGFHLSESLNEDANVMM